MYWKKQVGEQVEYVAVLKLVQIHTGQERRGQKTYVLTLADNTTAEHTFEFEECLHWQSRFGKGYDSHVINGD